MQLGNLHLKNNIFLAPLAGVSDRPFRVLCAKQGAGLVYTEMVSAKAILYNNKKTHQLLAVSPEVETVGIQLFGNEPETIAEAARRIDHEGIALFDVNMGCPVPKVVNNGEGSALMKEPARIGAIVEALVKAVDKPVTIKIRKGFEEDSCNAVEVGRIAQESGASAVGIHGRTREQFYSGKADWQSIRELKEALTIPVFGNGDIFSAEDAKAMLDTTGCDAVMVARGAQGNPWIFSEIVSFLETGVVPPRPSVEAIYNMIMEHKTALVEEKGEYIAIRELRKHVSWYTKGLKHATALRGEINQIDDLITFDETLKKLMLDQMDV